MFASAKLLDTYGLGTVKSICELHEFPVTYLFIYVRTCILYIILIPYFLSLDKQLYLLYSDRQTDRQTLTTVIFTVHVLRRLIIISNNNHV